jgi:hypothetical protein
MVICFTQRRKTVAKVHGEPFAASADSLKLSSVRPTPFETRMDKSHPVRASMELRLDDLRERYRQQPNEHTRYELVRWEQLIAQWAPSVLASP